MKRAIWFAVGAGAGVYLTARAKRIAEGFTPEGIADRFDAALVGWQMFRDQVLESQQIVETDLRHRLGMTPLSTPELPAQSDSTQLSSEPSDPSPASLNQTHSNRPNPNQSQPEQLKKGS